MEVVINKNFGGCFGVDKAVFDELDIEWQGFDHIDNEILKINSNDEFAHRYDKRLIDAIKKIGIDKASGRFSQLKIVDIPDNIEWEIYDNDGIETIHEKHRIWE